MSIESLLRQNIQTPWITLYAWDISHTLVTLYHPYHTDASALTEYLKGKLRNQCAKRLGRSLPLKSSDTFDSNVTLTFEEFMKEFRERWLPDNWEQIIRVAMLGTHLDPKIHCFESWAAQIMSHNVSLRNTNSFLTNDQLQSQLDIMMDVELQTLAQSQGVSKIKDLHKWMSKIKKIDTERQINLK